MSTARELDASVLSPYLPRLVLDWPTPEGPSYREIDGSLVFVDISGFTKMSERLAKFGKVGAEEVTEILNSTFTRLLAVAYENGGTLIKFGGDALLVFFYDPGHAARAVHAAAGMRRKLSEIGKGLTSSAGRVRLRMSVGVNTGLFQFFLVGDLHRELILTGPAASKTVEMESTAEAGEILLSKPLASLVDPSLLGDPKGEGILLTRMPPPPPAAHHAAVAGPSFDLAPFVPIAIRDRLAGGDLDPEHRRVTVAFVHFDGTDELVKTTGCSDVVGALHGLVSIAQHAASDHEVTFLGTDVDHDGGKIILVAGIPKTTGQDEERMLRTLRAILDEHPDIPVRIGTNAGHVFAGDVGPSYRRTYTVMGDAVNLAARVMAKATPGQVLATTSVLDRSRTLFETAPLEPFMVKGKAHPVTAFAVGAIRGARTEAGAEADELPFLGREPEMAILGEALGRAARGDGSLVEIVGAAGMGKSRLVAELRRRARDVRVLTVTAEQYEAQTPYFAFRRLLRAVLDIPRSATAAEAGRRLADVVAAAAPELRPWLPLLAVPVDASVPPTPETSGLDESFKVQRLHASVATLLERVLPEPALIAVEDAHWVDGASNELLRFVVRDLAERSWLIVVTSRPEGHTLLLSSERESTILALVPLPEASSAALVKEAAKELALPAHVLAALAERSGGHPLFLQELVAASRMGESLDALPDTVEAVINARMDALDTADRSLLRYAAVVGARFSLDILRDALPDQAPQVLERVTWSSLSEFLEPEGADAYRFRHMLFRDVAYEALPFRRRRELHARVGEEIERRSTDASEESAEVLSLHFDRAQRFDKSWKYSVLAGDRARSKFANVQAAEFYRRALDAARRLDDVADPELGRVYEALGDVSTQAALYDRAVDAYRSARKMLRAGPHLPRLHRKEGILRRLSGDYSRALSWFSRGLKIASDDDPEVVEERIELSIGYAGVLFHQGRYRECIRWCERVLPLAERLNLRSSLAHIYYLLHAAYTWLGDPRRAQYRSTALPIFEEIGDLLGQANALINIGADAYFAGEWDEALSVNRRAKDVLEKIGDVIGVADALNNTAEILSDQGNIDAAVECFSESESAYRAAKSRYGVALSEVNLGRAAARDGRDEDARRLLESALAGFREIKAESWIAEAQGRIAEAHVLARRPVEALELVEATLPATEKAGGLHALVAQLHRVRAYAHMQRGEPDEAEASIAESLRVARSAKALFEIALTLEASSRLTALRRDPSDRAAAEAGHLFSLLGVKRTPTVPLPG